VGHVERLVKERLEAETSLQAREAVNSIVTRVEVTSEGDDDTDEEEE
jgi:hypothetical protein